MMLRMKTILALLVLAAMAVVAPQAHATAANVQLWIAGSSALWQAMAISAYNSGVNINKTPVNASYTSTCHWTTGATSAGQAQNFSLIDSRLGKNLTDSGGAWVVWSVPHTSGNTSVQDCTDAASSNPNVGDVWVFASVDSVVGLHSYFAKSSMNSGYTVGSSVLPGANKISEVLYACTGADHTGASPCTTDDTPTQNVWNFLAQGAIVNVAATDIRPEDGAWAMCRANSPLGPSSVGTGNGTDSLDGLGYNTSGAQQASGECAKFNSNNTQALKNVFGNPVLSGFPGSTSKAQVAAFNIAGKDPATNAAVPAFTVYPIGAVPVVFIINEHAGTLAGVNNITDRQAQALFSGTTCNASVFGGSGALNVFVREPLSGTYNTVEANVTRYPTNYGNPPGVIGTSMETGVGANNPLATNCAGGGGTRYRAIGTGQEVLSVSCSNSTSSSCGGGFAAQRDGIGFTFFSYGNISSIAQNSDFNYLTLNGVDPIFQSYNSGAAANSIDPGNPGNGQLPKDTPCGTGSAAFPCTEQQLWQGGYSFPNLRNGTYRAWSLLRLVSTGTAGTNASALATSAEAYSVNRVPDFVPAKAVKNGTATVDPGLLVLRSHYLQIAGDGIGIGTGCTGTGTAGCKLPANVVEAQSDMGGVIIPTNAGGVKPGIAVNGVTFANGTGVNQIRNVQGSANDGTLGSKVRVN